MTPQQNLEIWIGACAMKRANMNFGQCIAWFLKKMELEHSDETFAMFPMLPPRTSNAWKGTVSRAICGYLQGGSDAMFKAGQTPLGLGLWLKDRKFQINALDDKRGDRGELRSTAKAFSKASAMKKLANAAWEDHKRSGQWNVCK